VGEESQNTSRLRIAVLGSGSKGNSIFIASPQTRVLVDAGFSCAQVEQRLAKIGESIHGINGIIISHEHHDHLRGVNTLIRRYGIPLFISEKTFEGARIRFPHSVKNFFITAGNPFSVGDLQFHPFTVPHDAIDPLGFVIQCNNEKIGIAVDLGFPSKLVEQKLRDCSVLILESNHDPEMLLGGPYPWELKQRIMSRLGHLSNTDLAELLKKILSHKVKYLFLAHLSETNNHPQLAWQCCSSVLEECNINHIKIIVSSQNKPTELLEIL
jgi:phosphoribosyl 1,2-cyclic phosphodiesterase